MTTEYEELIGKVFSEVENVNNERLVFKAKSGEVYEFYHTQDCCEGVYIEDICGELSDLVDSPLLQAEGTTSNEDPDGYKREYSAESVTWTFYRFATAKGQVVVRWIGESNGYYSESVDFMRVK